MEKLRTVLAAAIILAGVLVPTAFAYADQKDPRLDRLFAILQTSGNERELNAAQAAIWETWSRHVEADTDRLMRRGILALNAGDMPEAMAIFDTLVIAKPDFAEAWNKRATALFLLGELDRSAADVERTLALEPRHFGALSGLGRIEMLRGAPEAARAAFRGALAVNPHLPYAQEMLRQLDEKIDGKRL